MPHRDITAVAPAQEPKSASKAQNYAGRYPPTGPTKTAFLALVSQRVQDRKTHLEANRRETPLHAFEPINSVTIKVIEVDGRKVIDRTLGGKRASKNTRAVSWIMQVRRG